MTTVSPNVPTIASPHSSITDSVDWGIKSMILPSNPTQSSQMSNQVGREIQVARAGKSPMGMVISVPQDAAASERAGKISFKSQAYTYLSQARSAGVNRDYGPSIALYGRAIDCARQAQDLGSRRQGALIEKICQVELDKKMERTGIWLDTSDRGGQLC